MTPPSNNDSPPAKFIRLAQDDVRRAAFANLMAWCDACVASGIPPGSVCELLANSLGITVARASSRPENREEIINALLACARGRMEWTASGGDVAPAGRA